MVVLDAMNLERGLYLLLETLERFHHVMVILNKMDAALEQDVTVFHDRLEEELQVPVTPEMTQGRLNSEELFGTLIEVADPVAPGEVMPSLWEMWSVCWLSARGRHKQGCLKASVGQC